MMGGAGWMMMGLGMVLFWGLVIFGIVWIVRTVGGDDRRGSERHEATHERSPIEALDRSLAEGTIDVEDYTERRRVLTGSG
jgi:putative membrane protein